MQDIPDIDWNWYVKRPDSPEPKELQVVDVRPYESLRTVGIDLVDLDTGEEFDIIVNVPTGTLSKANPAANFEVAGSVDDVDDFQRVLDAAA